MDSGLPTPPVEDTMRFSNPKRHSSTSSKPKSTHRITKRTTVPHAHSPTHDHGAHSPTSLDNRHKRVWKACERCRMKKTKCDGEFPCKRCKDDGLVCTAGTRKKTEYKQIPRGYAEVLENTQHALIATVHKLYSMVRTGQSWDLGEPELNERGQPVIHNIATKLGCIRPNAEIDLPPHSVFPEDEAGLAKLAAELEIHQHEREVHAVADHKSETGSTHTDRGTPELEHSDLEQDYRKAAFLGNQSVQNMSPQSFTSCHDFDVSSSIQELDPPPSMFPMLPGAQAPSYPPWANMQTSTMSMTSARYMPGTEAEMQDLMMSQGLLESEFGTIKPHMLSVPNPEVMLGIGDPMIYSGYNGMDTLHS